MPSSPQIRGLTSPAVQLQPSVISGMSQFEMIELVSGEEHTKKKYVTVLKRRA
jgi:hypothetical protein